MRFIIIIIIVVIKLHSQLQRIVFKLGVTVHRCLQGKYPQYLIDCCSWTSNFASQYQLTVPRYRHSTFGRLVFSVDGPMTWKTTCPIISGTQLYASANSAEDTSRQVPGPVAHYTLLHNALCNLLLLLRLLLLL